jgi:hypothetical protein
MVFCIVFIFQRLRPDLEEKLSAALANIETDLKKMLDIPGFQVDEEVIMRTTSCFSFRDLFFPAM